MSDRTPKSGPARLRRAEEIFFAALEQPPAERSDFVRQRVGDDASLGDEVLALLAADSRQEADPDASLGRVGARAVDQLLVELARGTLLGRYRIVRKLGSGGFGTVYLAELVDAVEERVAIKLIRRGMDSEQILARFAREQQILENLDHPNIAKLLDADVAPDGRPYLVMEYVEGQRIDAYCKANALSLRQRLELFVELCRGVSNAHRNLIIHRDLKPSNILVTPGGTPKLLDFGTAKVLSGDGSGEAVTLTASEHRIMTPRYSSPEQIDGGAVTTSIDVFALGMLLYELLAETHPFESEGETRRELLERIAERDPPRPSSVQRSAIQPLHGDIDAIVMRALRKAPEERYGSVVELAADVQRFLESRPVLARHGNLAYRASRFVGRYRWQLASSAVALVLLLTFVFALSFQKQQAVQAQHKAELVTDYLRSLFFDLDPLQGRAEPVSVDELLDNGLQILDRGAAADDPEVERSLLTVMADLNASIGRRPNSIALLQRALSATEPDDLLEQARIQAEIGSNKIALGNFDEGAHDVTRALDLLAQRGATGTRDYGLALAYRGVAERHRGKYEAAVASFTEALDILTATGASARRIGETRLELALATHHLGKAREAYELATSVVEMWLESPSISPAKRVLAQEVQTTILAEAGDFARAVEISEEILAVRQRYLEPDHPHFLSSYYNLGALANFAGDFETAERYLRQTISLMRQTGDTPHPELPSALLWLGRSLIDQGRGPEAIPIVEESIALGEAQYGEAHEFSASAYQILGEAQWLFEGRDAALTSMGRARDIFHRIPVARAARTGKTHGLLASMQIDLADLDAAAATLGCEHLQQAVETSQAPADFFLDLANTRLRWFSAGDKDPTAAFAIEARRSELTPNEAPYLEILTAERLLLAGQPNEALATLNRSFAGPDLERPDELASGRASLVFGMVLHQQGKIESARSHLQAAVETLPPYGDRPLLGGTSARQLLATLPPVAS